MLLHQRGAGYGYFRNNPSSDARITAGFRDPRPTDLSVVVDMSGRLPDPPISPDDKVQRPSAADSHLARLAPGQSAMEAPSETTPETTMTARPLLLATALTITAAVPPARAGDIVG